ncbi:hypothetical protein JCM8547_001970 [Rhodosporidiobolus lusitaniae]
MADDEGAQALQRPRPSEHELLAQWTSYFSDPLLSLEALRKQADEGRLEERGLRSLSWRYFFSLLPSPTTLPSAPSASSATYSTHSLLLSHARSGYTELRERYLRAPDGKWVRDDPSSSPSGDEEKDSGLSSSTGSNGNVKGGKAVLEKVDVRHNNPLGDEEENPWKSWFADLDLRKTIRQDVQRTFPEVDYFRLFSTQNRLTDLLFIYTKLTPEIGYRQGMHELLAPLLWAVDVDSLPSTTDQTSLPHLVLSRDFVEHDAWSLFSALMKSAGVFYDHQTTSPNQVQPIVSIANNLQSLLSRCDHSLHAAFTSLNVEPQLYAIRWLRLLFGREFPLQPDIFILWDGLFARDPSLQLTTHIALAMLLRIRGALIPAAKEGYGEFLQILLRYPPSPHGGFHTALLVRQAVYLHNNLSSAGVEYVLRQNAELGAAVGEALPHDEEVDLRSPTARGMAHRRAASALPVQGLGLFGDLAKGVYARSEALGINKAITGAFNDIKRDFAEAQAQLEEQRRQRSQFSQIPSSSPWDPPTAPPPASKDALSDLAKMRTSSLSMSSAIDLCVQVLERELVPPTPVASPLLADDTNGCRGDIPLSTGKTTASHPPPLGTQTMALTALKHIRDVLGGQATTFDSSVLGPLRQVLEGSPQQSTTSAPFPPPSTFSSPPLPPLPSSPSPKPSSQPSLAPAPPSPARTVPAAALPAPMAAAPSASATPSLHLGARGEKPLTGLSRTPQPNRLPDVPRYPPSRPQTSHSGPPNVAQPPLRSTASSSTKTNPSFPPASFSTRPPSTRPRPSSSTGDPLGAS